MYKFILCVTQLLLSGVVIRCLYSNFMLESIRNIYIIIYLFRTHQHGTLVKKQKQKIQE